MISFFTKKQKIYVDCFTSIPRLTTLFPILNAKDRIPQFYKNLPTTVEHQGPQRGTMKTCPGVFDLYRNGIILQNWTDIWIDLDNNQFIWEPRPAGESHNPKQWNDEFKNYYHLKLVSPWYFKETSGVKWIYTNTFYHDVDFKPVVLNGLVEYKYQHTTSVNMLIPKKSYPKKFVIPAGKELAHIMPLSDKEVVVNMHEVDQEEMKKLEPTIFTFNGNYLKYRKLMKDREKGKL